MRKKEWWFAPRGTWNCVIQLMRPEKGIIPIPIRQETVFMTPFNFVISPGAVGIQNSKQCKIYNQDRSLKNLGKKSDFRKQLQIDL